MYQSFWKSSSPAHQHGSKGAVIVAVIACKVSGILCMCHITASQRVFLTGGAAEGQAGSVLLGFTDKIALVECFGEKRHC